jgi:hypothetical protein
MSSVQSVVHRWVAPVALNLDSRWAWLPMLSCIVLSSCSEGVGDLFTDTMAAEPAPTDSVTSDPSEPSQAPPSAPELTASVEPGRVNEGPRTPAARDDGVPAEANAGAGAPPATPPLAADDQPADEAAPPAAPEAPEAPVAPEPAPPVSDGEGPAIARVCANVDSPLLLDFDAVGDDPTQALFGDFGAELSGGTFVYPQADLPGGAASRGLVSDVMGGDWHISGSVGEQSGFGLFFDCQQLDASRFMGLAFRISGNVRAGTVTLLIGTAGNEISSAWRVANGGTSTPSVGRCTPARSEFDGTCNGARIDVPVSANSREVVVPFAALNGGSPERGVNPSEVTSISWALPMPNADGAGTEPYAVDLRIDDIRFVEAATPR